MKLKYEFGTDALNDRRANVDNVLQQLTVSRAPNAEMIGDFLLPALPQDFSTAKVGAWGTEAFRVRPTKVGDYSAPEKLDIGLSTTSIEVDGHALMAPVSRRHQQEAANGQIPYNLRAQALVTADDGLDVSRERGQAALVTASATYSSDTGFVQDLNALSEQWDQDAIDPFKRIIATIEGTIVAGSGKRANTLWMGQEVWLKFIQNPFVKNRIFGTTNPQGVPTEEQVARFLGIARVVIGRAVTLTAADVLSYIWGKKAGLIYVPPTSGERIPAFGYTVEQRIEGSASRRVTIIQDETMGAWGGEWVKSARAFTPAVLFQKAGALFDNAVA